MVIRGGVASRRLLGRIRKSSTRLLKPLSLGPAPRLQFYDSIFGASRGTPIDRFLMSSFVNDRYLATRRNRSGLRVAEFGDDSYSSAAGEDEAVVSVIEFDEGKPLGRRSHRSIISGDVRIGADESVRGSIDLVISTQVLFTQVDPKRALCTISNLLAEGGLLIGTEPFLEPISQYDAQRWGDWWRFTPRGLEHLLEEAGLLNVEVTPLGDPRLAAALILGMSSEDVPSEWLAATGSVHAPVLTGYVAAKPASGSAWAHG